MIEAANDYANIFQQVDILKLVQPVSNGIDEILNRLDELESLMNIVKTDAAITMHKNLPEIYSYFGEFTNLCQNIDNLEQFVHKVNDNLIKVEQQVSQAEEELGINDTGIKGLFRPLFGKTKKSMDLATSGISNDNIDISTTFVPVIIFNSSDYFGEPENSGDVDNVAVVET